MTTTATLSALLRHPKDVIDQLDEGDVVITRRDGENLRLTRDDDSRRDTQIVGALASLIGATVLDENLAPRLAERLSTPFPWVEFLTDDERRDFVGEFLRTARACASVDNFNRLGVAVAAWHETARIKADVAWTDTELEYLADPEPVPDPRDTSE